MTSATLGSKKGDLPERLVAMAAKRDFRNFEVFAPLPLRH
jgi:hypothetical protein